MLKLAFYKWLTSLSHGDGQSRGIKAATFARQAAGDSPAGTISDLSDLKKISSKFNSNLQNIIGFAPVVFLGRGMFQARLYHHL